MLSLLMAKISSKVMYAVGLISVGVVLCLSVFKGSKNRDKLKAAYESEKIYRESVETADKLKKEVEDEIKNIDTTNRTHFE